MADNKRPAGGKVFDLQAHRAAKKSASKPPEARRLALEQLLEPPEPPPKASRRRSAPAPTTNQMQSQVQQSINGDGNTQVAGDLHLTVQTTSRSAPRVGPAPGTIGANGGLRLRIDTLVKEIQRNRAANHGKDFKYGSVQGIAAQALGLKKDEWGLVWGWDESRAPEVIERLEQARDNTKQGRINKAASKPSYKHTRGHLFRLEADYLSQLGWSDDEARYQRDLVIGKGSRKDMTDNEFRNWVAHLDVLVRRLYGEA